MSPLGDILSLYGDIVGNETAVMKDKDQTKSKIISAVGELIAESGFSKAGVNAIARQAGVDKVLIYRYFGGLDGLYKAYAESSDFWPSLNELMGPEEARLALLEGDAAETLGLFFRRYIQALRSRPHTLEVLAWETVERNALTIELESVRERFGLETAAYFQNLELPDFDWLAITNMFVGAIHYFVIRARKITYFTGMDLNDEASWQRLADSIEVLIKGLTPDQKSN